MKLKKLLSLLLAGAMAFSVAACSQDQGVTNNPDASSAAASSEADASDESVRPTEPTGQLVIGTLTDLESDFYDASFNNTATNYKLYDLLHGYGTVVSDVDGAFVYDPTVVKSHEEVENEDGTKTYTVTINDGLVWSDGTPITAKDYVFRLLLESSPEMNQVDGYPSQAGYSLVGYDAYFAGETENFAGVHLVDDMTYSVTVKAEELPYHYDITYATAAPRPMHVIAPDCDVVDSAEGASITGEFTADLLLKTINDPDTGYRYNPSVVCGPYMFESYDTASRQGTVVVNPNYAGDYRGVKPVIEKVIIKTVKNDTMINELASGSVDLLFQCSGADTINGGLDLVDQGKAQKNTFFRNGYGKIQFDCSQFPTDSQNVRQAIAYCLDRGEFARQYSGGYASVVHSYYGLAQWEYQESKTWIDENLETYEKNIDKAKELLDADGWNKNADGSDYSGTGTRYKEVDGELKPLVIEWANTDANPVSELLATMLPEAMTDAGMELKATTMDFPTLSACISHSGDKIYNMYNLATGFPLASSPWYYYSTDPVWMQGGYNSNWISDTDLEAAAYALKPIAYDDDAAWLPAWQNFIKVWNEKLPDVPLYSDEYYDFYSTRLKGWSSSSVWEWSRAVLDAWVVEE
ncbi:MAG TPA: ABC transporter substrate-binding protein [Candidatus Caccousia avicola]|uniref:ABC transporter substrate-binding protein n=1 Tax=Candidatus Caccousia avicola TaxID=2840721 RepID=A0A9D1AQS9_9FIRM|nr:ABC transporter substrate-binding protein [Candidatus Caccousia avicola]